MFENDKMPTINVAFVFSFMKHLIEIFNLNLFVGCSLIIRLEFHSKLFGRLSYNSTSYETPLHIHYVGSMIHIVGFNLLSTN